MRPLHALLLSLAATAAVTGAETHGHHGDGPQHGGMGRQHGGMGPRDEETGEKPCTHGHGEEHDGLMAYLNDGLQRSNEMVQRFFGFGEPQEVAQQPSPAIRVVVIEEEEEKTGLDASERQTACLKALELLRARDEMAQQAETLLDYFRTAYQSVTLRVWDEASCDDLGRQALADECNRVLSSEMAVREYLQSGQTNEEVCAIMTASSDDNNSVAIQDDELMQKGISGPVGNDTLSCKLCQRLVQMVDQALEQEVQQVQQVRAIIGDLCDAMAKDSMCHMFINNFDAIVAWLKHGTDPMVVCTRIAMCSPESSALPAEAIQNDEEEAEEADYWAMERSEHHRMVDHVHDAKRQTCSFCSHVVGVMYKVSDEAPDQLPMLKTALSSLCQFASPDASCEEVEENFEKIVELAKQGQHPRELCGTLGLCRMDPKMPLGEMDSTQPCDLGYHGKGDAKCEYCDAATTVLEIVMQEAPGQVDQIREYADMICNMLGDDSPCHEYVSQLDTVIDALQKGTHPRDICKVLKYCTAEREERSPFDQGQARVGMMRPGHRGRHHQLRMMGPGERRGHHGHRHGRYKDSEMMRAIEHPLHIDGCFFCSRVATVIHHVSHATPDKLPVLKMILSNLCQLVPSGCKCETLDKNFDKMAALEKEGKCPFQVCKSVDVCNKTLDAEQGPLAMEHALKGVVVASQWPSISNTTQCTYCQFATTVAKIALQQYGANIRQVREYADMICDMLGEDNPCHVYVKQMDFVIDSITQGMSSKAICTSLKFCTAKMLDDQLTIAGSIDEESSGLVQFDPALVEAVTDAMTVGVDACFFCTQVTTVVEVAVVEDPTKIAQIRQIADVVCGMLPIENQCHAFVKQFDTVVDSLQKGEQPKAICHDLKYCPTDMNPALSKFAAPSDEEAAIQSTHEGNNTCSYCSGVVTVLKFVLAQKPEQVKELREAAGIACQLMPEGDTCHDDLKIFDEAVAGLQSGKEPHTICQLLKFCTDAKVSSSVLSAGVLDFTGADFVVSQCATCQQNSLLLASLITRPDSVATFKKEMDTVCRLVPESSECELLMKHEDVIIDSLEKEEDVEVICTRIEACKSASEETTKGKSLSVGCLFCEYTAEMLAHAGHNEMLLRRAKVTLETMCTILPPRAHCDVLSSKFDEIVSLVQAGKSPREACHAVALCDAASVSVGQVIQPEDVATGDATTMDELEQSQQAVGNVMEIQ